MAASGRVVHKRDADAVLGEAWEHGGGASGGEGCGGG